MTPTQSPTFTQRVIGDGGGFVYLLASGGTPPGINFDFTTGVLPGAITFTRPSIGTYNSSGNLLVTAGNDVARFNYVAGVANLLIEGSATNLFVQSNAFTTAPWGNIRVPVVTSSQFVSPDGTNNGWSMDNGNGVTFLSGGVNQTITFSNTAYVLSIWAKTISGSNPPLNLLIAGNSTAPASISITSTLTRYSGSLVAAAGAADGLVLTTGTAAHNVVIGIYGAQLETGSTPTSYIPTTTAPVTRAADSATFTIPAGIGHLTFTFDDNTTQLVAVSAGSYTIPTTLNRPNLKSIVGSA